MEIPPQLDTELSDLLEKYLIENDTISAVDVIKENKFSETLKENCSDLIPLVTRYFSEVVSKENPNVFECCKTLICIIAQKSRPQDVIYELMNIIETCDEDFKLLQLLPAYSICWSRIPNNRLETLQWSLNSIFIYLENILDANEDIQEQLDLRLLNLCNAIGDFSLAVLPEIPENFLGPKNKRNILTKFIVKVIGKPLGYFDDKSTSMNTNIKYTRDKFLTILIKLVGDIFIFLAHFDIESCSVDNVFDCQLSSLGVVYYLLFVENIQYSGLYIYNPPYIVNQVLFLATALLKEINDVLILKGIHLANSILDLVSSINENELCTNLYKSYFLAVSHIIVYNESAELRKVSLNVLSKTILKFDDKGKYLLFLNLIPQISHSGLKGFCCMLYKDILLEAFKKNTKLPYHFRGRRLFRILNMFAMLPAGSESDLIDLADQIISALNTLRFIIIRDKQDCSEIWNYMHDIKQIFLIPLREGLKMSRAHYEMKLQELYNSKNTPNEDLSKPDIEISVANGKLPEISKENEIAAIKSSLNAFDMMENLLTCLEETIETREKNN